MPDSFAEVHVHGEPVPLRVTCPPVSNGHPEAASELQSASVSLTETAERGEEEDAEKRSVALASVGWIFSQGADSTARWWPRPYCAHNKDTTSLQMAR